MIVLAITLLLIAVILALYTMLRVGAMVDKEKEEQNGASHAEGHSSKRNVTRSKKSVSKSSGKVVRGSGKTTRKSKGER